MQISAEHDAIPNAVNILNAGGLVAFPTETVYGLGADATNESAVQRIFKAKGRPSNNPLILHFASFELIKEYVDFSRLTDIPLVLKQLDALKALWPGPLSLILPRGKGIADAVCCGGDTIAVRIPNHPLALQLLGAFGKPIAAPSANQSSYVSPTTAEHVRDSLGNKVQAILDGGKCQVGVESTVLSLVHSPPRILRPGAVTRRQISECISQTLEVLEETSSSAPSTRMLSPGLLSKHYSPRTRVIMTAELEGLKVIPDRIGAIRFSSAEPRFRTVQIRCLSQSGELNEIAANLFDALREFDELGLDLIVVDSCAPVGLGEAIMDRVVRATHR